MCFHYVAFISEFHLAPFVSFLCCAGEAQCKAKGVEEWLWHSCADLVAIKLLAFVKEDMWGFFCL